MAVPASHAPTSSDSARTRRSFELRKTAMYFLLLAVIVTLTGLTARTVAAAAERRPAWAFALALLVAAGGIAFWRRRRRISAVKLARRAARALDDAAETAVDVLDETPPVSGPARPGDPDLPTAPVTPAGSAAPNGSEPADAPTGGGPVEPEQTAVLVGPAADPLDAAYEALDPYEFEEAMAELCRRDGCWDVEVVGGAGDLGADVVARTPDGRLLVVQCKRYGDTNRVGSQDMQRFGGTCFTVHGADVAVMVTTSDFTAPALEYAEQCGIVCVNGPDLQRWRDGTGPSPWEAGDTAA
ncbi:restriction endonuclease [Streptomyces sp. enrichment culture]|uniref:restriction endonuclease n=1 Tax=Streptomyces sp. enrichment culture TaxID=1795815 RepID=UPI003F545DD4